MAEAMFFHISQINLWPLNGSTMKQKDCRIYMILLGGAVGVIFLGILITSYNPQSSNISHIIRVIFTHSLYK